MNSSRFFSTEFRLIRMVAIVFVSPLLTLQNSYHMYNSKFLPKISFNSLFSNWGVYFFETVKICFQQPLFAIYTNYINFYEFSLGLHFRCHSWKQSVHQTGHSEDLVDFFELYWDAVFFLRL